MDRGTPAQLILLLGLTLVVALLPGRALASSGGIAPSFGIIPRGATDTGFRYRIDLTSHAGVLTGRSRMGAVEELMVAVPGAAGAHVIVREIDDGHGGTSLLLTAPPSLATRTQRVTLMLRRDRLGVDLWERVGDRWARREGEVIAIASASRVARHLTFSLSHLGPYWLTERGTGVHADTISPAGLLAGGIGAALSAWLWPAVALGLAALVARVAHRTQGKVP